MENDGARISRPGILRERYIFPEVLVLQLDVPGASQESGVDRRQMYIVSRYRKEGHTTEQL
jgi:hypothetical protein